MALLWNLPHARNTMRTTKEHQHRVGQRDARGDDDKWHALTPFLVAASCTAPSVRHGGVPPSVVDSTSDGVREPCVLVRWRQRFNYGTVIANSLLSYPRKSGDAVNEMTSLSNLTEELTLYVPTVPEPFPRGRFGWPFLQLKIFSLGSIVGRASPASFLGTPVAEGRSG
ncbi:hypothetical protein OsJ_07975 [Oryza sativa Japonica Group]|uniref:Uncharacterized protein n=1 Tax=Oryza sativa subsp. japonica TaxID=39947 RepID=B9F1W0_ORYSJ|nr:hypothetical protein OsJ_07975 [Oryza sativa Japonica Group]